jgi:hypothetical protein
MSLSVESLSVPNYTKMHGAQPYPIIRVCSRMHWVHVLPTADYF